jgi:transcription initiation factor TFIIE subunit alpha
MRLSNKVTDDFVREVVGDDAVKLVNLLRNKTNVSEFKLAEKLKLTVNHVRNILYRLQEHNLVTSVRKKDKKKGWYIYYWTFNTYQAKVTLSSLKKKKLDDLKSKLTAESLDSFFWCPKDETRLKVDYAMEHDFKCPECGTLLKQQDNDQYLAKIRKEIEELESELTQK